MKIVLGILFLLIFFIIVFLTDCMLIGIEQYIKVVFGKEYKDGKHKKR